MLSKHTREGLVTHSLPFWKLFFKIQTPERYLVRLVRGGVQTRLRLELLSQEKVKGSSCRRCGGR